MGTGGAKKYEARSSLKPSGRGSRFNRMSTAGSIPARFIVLIPRDCLSGVSMASSRNTPEETRLARRRHFATKRVTENQKTPSRGNVKPGTFELEVAMKTDKEFRAKQADLASADNAYVFDCKVTGRYRRKPSGTMETTCLLSELQYKEFMAMQIRWIKAENRRAKAAEKKAGNS